jgi:hypothetical protein
VNRLYARIGIVADVEESGERVRLQQLADAGIQDRMLPPADKPPVHSAVPPHDFVESEFPEGAGHCDICGGGPDAPIHHHVDPLERIAAALDPEKLASYVDSIDGTLASGVVALERLAMAAEGILQVVEAMLEMMRAEAAK